MEVSIDRGSAAQLGSFRAASDADFGMQIRDGGTLILESGGEAATTEVTPNPTNPRLVNLNTGNVIQESVDPFQADPRVSPKTTVTTEVGKFTTEGRTPTIPTLRTFTAESPSISAGPVAGSAALVIREGEGPAGRGVAVDARLSGSVTIDSSSKTSIAGSVTRTIGTANPDGATVVGGRTVGSVEVGTSFAEGSPVTARIKVERTDPDGPDNSSTSVEANLTVTSGDTSANLKYKENLEGAENRQFQVTARQNLGTAVIGGGFERKETATTTEDRAFVFGSLKF